MKHFTIDSQTGNITIHASQEAEAGPKADGFGSQMELAELAANWPTSRLVDIWNSLPGAAPVKKFEDRATGVARIWKLLQTQAEAVPGGAEETGPEESLATPHGSDTPSVEAEGVTQPEAPSAAVPSTPRISKKRVPAKARAPRAKSTVVEEEANPGGPREGSKVSQVIAMLRRDGGASVEEIMAAMNWQKHTTRALLSAGGSLRKNYGLTVTMEKTGDERRYAIRV